MRRAILAILLEAAALTPQTVQAQSAPPPARPLTCEPGTVFADPTVPVLICDYPGTISRTVQLNARNARNMTLLYVVLDDGTRIFTPEAQRQIPNAWATIPGETFVVIPAHPDFPECPSLAGPNRLYGYASSAGPHGTIGIVMSLDGNAGCVLPPFLPSQRSSATSTT